MVDEAISPRALGRTAGLIMVAGAVVGVPGSWAVVSAQHRTLSLILSASVAVLGVFCWFAPWDRWPARRTVIIPIACIVMLSGGISQAERADTLAAFFVVIFAWTGIAHAPWTCLKMAPLAVVGYGVPVLLTGGDWSEASLALFYVPVAALTGEALAWLAERLRASERGVRQLGELKDDFLAMVAHDMRTPVVIISGFTEELRARGDELTPAQRDQALDAIGRNARRASEFVENLLQFARIEADEFKQSPEPFDMGALVHRIVDDYVATDKDHNFTIRVRGGLPYAHGDETRNGQVLGNLISNAIKYSPLGAPILVDVDAADAGFLSVSVHDHGRGVPADEVGKLFQKFAQIHRSDDVKRAVSTGLGLYICRGIVERQGGKIWFEDRPGPGATFVYTVPTADRLAPARGDVLRVDPTELSSSADRREW
jgi:signal transduction histidine kinase